VSDEQDAGAKQAPKRVQAGRFAPGQSGNPRGKAPGTRNRQTLILEGLVDKSGPKLVLKAIKMAMDGDSAVMRALLPLLLPARRERPVEFPLPSIESAEDALRASRTILSGACNGALTPSEAAEMGKLLELHAKLLGVHDLEPRLQQLERERGIGLHS
jgi:hypothetical protein